MPTYEYFCEKGHNFEEFQSIVAAPIEVCPICGAKATRKVSGGAGLIFKGSGFYITDYAHKNYSGDSAKSSSSSSESKSESAPSAPSTPPPAPKTDSAPKSETPKKD